MPIKKSFKDSLQYTKSNTTYDKQEDYFKTLNVIYPITTTEEKRIDAYDSELLNHNLLRFILRTGGYISDLPAEALVDFVEFLIDLKGWNARSPFDKLPLDAPIVSPLLVDQLIIKSTGLHKIPPLRIFLPMGGHDWMNWRLAFAHFFLPSQIKTLVVDIDPSNFYTHSGITSYNTFEMPSHRFTFFPIFDFENRYIQYFANYIHKFGYIDGMFLLSQIIENGFRFTGITPEDSAFVQLQYTALEDNYTIFQWMMKEYYKRMPHLIDFPIWVRRLLYAYQVLKKEKYRFVHERIKYYTVHSYVNKHLKTIYHPLGYNNFLDKYDFLTYNNLPVKSYRQWGRMIKEKIGHEFKPLLLPQYILNNEYILTNPMYGPQLTGLGSLPNSFFVMTDIMNFSLPKWYDAWGQLSLEDYLTYLMHDIESDFILLGNRSFDFLTRYTQVNGALNKYKTTILRLNTRLSDLFSKGLDHVALKPNLEPFNILNPFETWYNTSGRQSNHRYYKATQYKHLSFELYDKTLQNFFTTPMWGSQKQLASEYEDQELASPSLVDLTILPWPIKESESTRRNLLDHILQQIKIERSNTTLVVWGPMQQILSDPILQEWIGHSGLRVKVSLSAIYLMHNVDPVTNLSALPGLSLDQDSRDWLINENYTTEMTLNPEPALQRRYNIARRANVKVFGDVERHWYPAVRPIYQFVDKESKNLSTDHFFIQKHLGLEDGSFQLTNRLKRLTYFINSDNVTTSNYLFGWDVQHNSSGKAKSIKDTRTNWRPSNKGQWPPKPKYKSLKDKYSSWTQLYWHTYNWFEEHSFKPDYLLNNKTSTLVFLVFERGVKRRNVLINATGSTTLVPTDIFIKNIASLEWLYGILDSNQLRLNSIASQKAEIKLSTKKKKRQRAQSRLLRRAKAQLNVAALRTIISDSLMLNELNSEELLDAQLTLEAVKNKKQERFGKEVENPNSITLTVKRNEFSPIAFCDHLVPPHLEGQLMARPTKITIPAHYELPLMRNGVMPADPNYTLTYNKNPNSDSEDSNSKEE